MCKFIIKHTLLIHSFRKFCLQRANYKLKIHSVTQYYQLILTMLYSVRNRSVNSPDWSIFQKPEKLLSTEISTKFGKFYVIHRVLTWTLKQMKSFWFFLAIIILKIPYSVWNWWKYIVFLHLSLSFPWSLTLKW